MKTYLPNLLAFPGRAPGFDPSHPAAGPNPRFSAVAVGKGFVSLLNGQGGTASSSSIDGTLGQTSTVTSLGQGQFSGQFTGNDTVQTLAAIIRTPATFVNHTGIFSTNTGSNFNGFFLEMAGTTGQFAVYTSSAGNPISAFNLATSTPYFIAVSAITGKNYFVATNLLTGQISTSTNGNAWTTVGGNGIFQIGWWRAESGIQSPIAAVMASAQFMSLPQLLAWAADPWAFWYPRTQTDLMFETLGAPSGGGTAYSLSLGSVSYSLTGTPDTFGIGMPLSSSSYSYAGTNTNFGIGIPAGTGSYAVTGDPATFGIGMPLGNSSYTYAGTQVSFNKKVSILPGTSSYVFTGGNPSLTYTPSGQTTSVSHYLPWFNTMGRFRSF